MTTHIGYLPDMGRWLFWIIGGIAVIVLAWGILWMVQAWMREGKE